MIAEASKQDYLIKNTDAGPVEVPEDFSFALTWGTYGISSFDSETGKLVKTTDAANPDDYVTVHTLTEEEKAYIYDLFASLDIFSYPAEYEADNAKSEPPSKLILTVRFGDTQKNIRSEDTLFIPQDKKGQALVKACDSIARLLMATPEWTALPVYEKYYE